MLDQSLSRNAKRLLFSECMNLVTFDPRSPKLFYHRSLLTDSQGRGQIHKLATYRNFIYEQDISFDKDRIPALAGLAA